MLDYGGKYLTTARFMFQRYTNEVSMMVYNVGWLHLLRNFKFWLTLINWTLVLTRSTNEFRAARTIKRKGRPLFWDYLAASSRCLSSSTSAATTWALAFASTRLSRPAAGSF